jgi:hypothetical protein
MREHPIDQTIRKQWKKHPLRIADGSKSKCCGLPNVLVESMRGGFVTRNCPGCNGYTTLTNEAFRGLALWVACPSCRQPMTATQVKSSKTKSSNHGYECVPCRLWIQLAALLPRFEDL